MAPPLHVGCQAAPSRSIYSTAGITAECKFAFNCYHWCIVVASFCGIVVRSLIFGEQVWVYFLCNTCICEAEAECKGHARVSAVISPALFPNPPTLGSTTAKQVSTRGSAHHSGLQRRVPMHTLA